MERQALAAALLLAVAAAAAAPAAPPAAAAPARHDDSARGAATHGVHAQPANDRPLFCMCVGPRVVCVIAAPAPERRAASRHRALCLGPARQAPPTHARRRPRRLSNRQGPGLPAL